MAPHPELPPALRVISNRWAVLGIARCWLVIGVAVWFAAAMGIWWAFLGAVIVIGIMQYHLSVLGHHSTHGNLFSSPSMNDAAAKILLYAPLGLTFRGARRNHLRHHVHFQEEEDYERDNYDLKKGGRDTSRGLFRWLGGAYVGAAAVPTIKRVLRGEKQRKAVSHEVAAGRSLGDWAIVVAVQFAIVGTLTMGTGHWWAYPVLWVLPLFTITNGLSITRATLEHADLAEPPSRLMTFPANTVERFLWGPFHFNWHAEHHLFPGVPACNLPALHRHVQNTRPADVIVVQSYARRAGMLFAQAERGKSEPSSA